MKKAKYYCELAAIGGSIVARYHLGGLEGLFGNTDRSTKYFVLAAKAGEEDAMKAVTELYSSGMITKDEYAITLRAHQKIRDEMRSVMREEAARYLGSSPPN